MQKQEKQKFITRTKERISELKRFKDVDEKEIRESHIRARLRLAKGNYKVNQTILKILELL